MPVSPEEFRSCLGSWPSGVTIVTSRSGERIHDREPLVYCGGAYRGLGDLPSD